MKDEAAIPHRFAALDSLRGIAALGVAVHHIDATSGPASLRLFANGGLFVDFFFVLSGFVIAASYGARLAEGFPLRRFAVLRLGRVWPVHAVMVGAALVLEVTAVLIGSHGLLHQAPFVGTHSPGHFFLSLALLNGFMPDPRNFYSMASWSISVELLLYLLAALAFRNGRAGIALLLVLGLLGVGGQVAGVNLPVLSAAVMRGLAGFALGTGCWLVHRRGLRLAPATLSWLELGSLTALFGAIGLGSSAVASAVVIGPAAVTVLVFAQDGGALSRLFHRLPWTWLGAISYSIYMVHAMVEGRVMDLLLVLSRLTGVHLAEYVSPDSVPVKLLVLDPLASTLVQLGMIAAVLLAAHFVWRLIEEPARMASRRLAASI